MRTKKKWKYHTSYKATMNNGTVFTMASQLYKIGVYCIINSNSRLQLNLTPAQMVLTEKRLNKGIGTKFKSIEYGREITVTEDDSGFYVELEDQLVVQEPRDYAKNKAAREVYVPKKLRDK